MKRATIASVVLLFLAIGAFTAFGGSKGDSRSADVIFRNGRIITVNDDFDIVEAIAIRDGRIIAVGSNTDMGGLEGAETRVVDLRGRTALPGLYDNHVHLGVDRERPNEVDLAHVENLGDLQAALREHAATLPQGAWITGHVPHGTGGVEPFTEENLPTRWDLDAAVSDHPVALNRGHIMLVNSLALEKAGIDRSTPQPPGGRIDKNDAGEPIGVLRETPARRRITSIIPEPPPVGDEAAIRSLRQRLENQLALGKTSINVPGVEVGSGMLRWLQMLYEHEGDLLPRLTVQVRLSPGYDTYDDPAEGIRNSIREIEGLQVHTGFGDDRLKLGAVKMSVDGAFSGQAAWLLDDYKGRRGYRGTTRIPESTLYPVAKRAHDLGWQLGIHAIGDAAVQMTVDVLARILEESPREDHRHYIHHIEVKPPEATLRKMAEYDIIAAMQPNFTYTIAPFLSRGLEGDKLQENNPQRSLQDHGIRMSYGSDGLPDNPFVGLYAAVTRRGIEGGLYGPDERMPVEDAIRNYTLGTAYMTFDEDERGSLEVGKVGDLTVIDRNILTIDPEHIKDLEVEMTVIGGEIVYSRSDAIASAS